MPIQARLMKPSLASIKNKLLDEQARLAKKAGVQYCKLITAALNRTIKYWGDSGENRYPVPLVDCEHKVHINRSKGQVVLKLRATMIDPSDGEPHFIWHILTQGRRAYTFPEGKRTPPLKRRRNRRTAKNRLDANPFGGFTGEIFVIHGGQRVKAVEGNQWYETAAKEVIASAKSDPLLKHWLPKVQVIKMERRA